MEKSLKEKISELKEQEKHKPCIICQRPINAIYVSKIYCSGKCKAKGFRMGILEISLKQTPTFHSKLTPH
ncbi:MAG: hypothetical protein PSX36_06755, partial [bacterium]|nr:hypothetical protein [bacterium]